MTNIHKFENVNIAQNNFCFLGEKIKVNIW